MIILLMEQTKAYPERKIEVKFRIGEREEKIAGGELDDPHQSTYPIPELSFARVSVSAWLLKSTISESLSS